MKRTRFLLILDAILLVSLILLIEPRFAGLAVHEWLGLAIIPLLVIHILYAWRWIAATLPRLGAKGAWRLRVNVVLNVAFFIAFTVATFSGVMTSFIALPALGIAPGNYGSWLRVHNQWTLYVQILAGLHLAMNWGWIVGAVRRVVLARPTAKGDAALGALAAEPPEA
jgi:hypothetical protein